MSENPIDSAVIKRTQETLGKYIKKPPLTDKLLSKPPFRFLHDLFNAIIKETGYFVGLYTDDELNIENIKDRDDKMRFLQKMIDLIQKLSGNKLSVKTSKIVAGHEAHKTNELLQKIAEVIDNKLDWKNALENSENMTDPIVNAKGEKNTKDKVKERSKASTTKTISPTNKGKNEKLKKTSSISKEPQTKMNKSSKEKVTKERDRGKDKEVEKSRKLAKSSEESKKVKKSLSKSDSKSSLSPEKNKLNDTERILEKTGVLSVEHQLSLEEEKPDERRPSLIEQETNKPQETELENKKTSTNLNETSTVAMNEVEIQKESGSRKSSGHRKDSASSNKSRRSSANKNNREREGNDVKTTNNRDMDVMKSVNEEDEQKTQKSNGIVKRESTFINDNAQGDVNKENSTTVARPRTSLRPPSARPASARPGAPRRRDKNIEIILQPNDQIKMSGINIKLETFNDLMDDDGENLVVIENSNNINNMNDEQLDKGTNDNENNFAMDNQQQQGHLVQQIIETQKQLVQQSPSDKQPNEKDFDRQNGRQSSGRQMDNLRDIIQNLTKSIHPFAKLLDFIPEDIDAMQLEMKMWRDTYTQASIALKRERSLTETTTEPLKVQIVEIENNIKEYVEMIAASRTKILQNSEKILKMLTDQ